MDPTDNTQFHANLLAAVRGRAEEHSKQRSGNKVLLILGVPILAIAVYFTLGMPGMDHTAAQHDMASMTSQVRQVGPDAFAALLADPAVVAINVHVPYEGELAGTDAFIDYQRIVGSPSLPVDKTTPIAVYCRSGRMSTIASAALIAAGYTNVSELTGGMNSWEAAGRAVDRRG